MVQRAGVEGGGAVRCGPQQRMACDWSKITKVAVVTSGKSPASTTHLIQTYVQ